MNCECEACLDDERTPPFDHRGNCRCDGCKMEMAYDACWQDMGDFE